MKNPMINKTTGLALVMIVLLAASITIGQTRKKTVAKPVPEKVAKPATITAPVAAPPPENKPMAFRFVEQMPEFKGDLNGWLASNLRYPDSARLNNVEGRSAVEFIVTEEGAITEARVVRTSGNPYLDDEALRAIRSMPAWKPGKQQGKAVPVIFTLPVTFRLED